MPQKKTTPKKRKARPMNQDDNARGQDKIPALTYQQAKKKIAALREYLGNREAEIGTANQLREHQEYRDGLTAAENALEWACRNGHHPHLKNRVVLGD